MLTDVVDSLSSDIREERDKEHPGGNLVILDLGGGSYCYTACLMEDRISYPFRFIPADSLPFYPT